MKAALDLRFLGQQFECPVRGERIVKNSLVPAVAYQLEPVNSGGAGLDILAQVRGGAQERLSASAP